MAMRDEIHKAILEGGATKESLLALTGTTEKGLASQFTYLRMTGRCPKKQEDGTFKIISPEEWEAHRASSGGAAQANLSPAKKVENAEKRSKRAASAYDNAKKRNEADPENKLNELKLVKAGAELEIAEIELGIAEKNLADAPPEPQAEIEADEDTPDVDDTPPDDEGELE
jgi:hypothetical protein